VITLRHDSRLHHIGLGRRLTGTRVLVLVADLGVRVLTEHGELIRELTLDPTRDLRWNDVPRHVGTMSRDITSVPPTGQKSKNYPQVEGLPVALSKRYAKIRRDGYRRRAPLVDS
jgi:hypothetical protein